MRPPLLLALVALATGAGVIGSRYRECMRGSRYDEDCDRQRWQDEQEAKKKGRRAAIIVGAH